MAASVRTGTVSASLQRLGRLRDRTAEAQQHRASGSALVTATIALWDTYFSRALTRCAAVAK